MARGLPCRGRTPRVLDRGGSRSELRAVSRVARWQSVSSPFMSASSREDRRHREVTAFLLEAHERILTEQDGAAFAKRVAQIRVLAERLRARYASADERKLVAMLRKRCFIAVRGSAS